MEQPKYFETIPLYRYLSCPSADEEKKEWVRQILVDHQLFFASRRDFNDPFDCAIPSLLQIPGTFLKRYAEEFVDHRFQNSSESEKLLMIKRLMSGSRWGQA